MPEKPLPRPRQVTFSGWSIIVGSVLTVLFAFQRVAELGSLEAQEAAADFISTPPGDGLGLGVDDVQTAIRIMCLVAGGAAAAAAILGWQVLQRSRSARLALSIIAPVLFVAGLTSGGLFSALVAAATVLLWLQPARDWFDGKAPVRDAAGARAMEGGAPYSSATTSSIGAAGSTGAPGSATGSAGSAGGSDEPSRSEGASAGSATMTDMTQTNPYGAPPPPPPHGGQASRPGRVTAAAVTTILASALTFAALGASLVFMLTSRADFVRQVEDELATNPAYEDFSADTIASVAIGFLAVLLVWCLAAIVLAVLTLRGSNGARITLVVSAVASALVSLLGVVVIVPLLLTAASIAVVVLLLTGPAGAWFAAQKRRG